MKKVTAAVIGCGVVSPEHFKSYQFIEGVTVKWACDLIEERAKAKAQAYGVPRVATDFRQVLADPEVDCISICTDHASHSPIAVAALEAGKDVLCEKALAESAASLEAMVAAHKRNPDRIFGGVFQHRFDAVSVFLKRLVDEGAFGKLILCNASLHCVRTDAYYAGDAWRGTWAQEGGAVLINQTIHFLDQAVWLMGGVSEVRGTWANLTHQRVMETEDTAVAALRYRNGALGSLSATVSSNLSWDPVVSIRGTRGSVDIRNGVATLAVFADEELQKRAEEGFAAAKERQDSNPVKSYYGPNHPALIADFVDAVRTRRQPTVTAESARHTVDVVLAVYESHKTGRAVPIRES